MPRIRFVHALWMAMALGTSWVHAVEEAPPSAGGQAAPGDAPREDQERPANFDLSAETIAEFEALVASFDGEPAREDFAALEEHFASMRKVPAPSSGGVSWLEWGYEQFAAPKKSDLESFQRSWEKFDRWIAAFPESPTPLVCKAWSHIRYGWNERGGGYANTVSEARWAVFHDQLETALGLLEQARQMQGHDPEVYSRLIVVGMALGAPRRVIDEYLDEARQLDPAYFPAYENVAVELLPRWGGNPGDVGRFAERMLAEYPGDMGLEIYARIAARVNRYDKLLLLDGEFDLSKVCAGAKILQRRYPDSVALMNFAGLAGWRGQNLELAKASQEIISKHFQVQVWGHAQYAKPFLQFCKLTVAPAPRKRIVWVLPGLSRFTTFSPSGKSLVVGMQSQGASVNVLSLKDLSVTAEVGSRRLCEGVAVDPAGKRVAAAYMADPDGMPAAAEMYEVGDWQNPTLLMDARVESYSSPCFSPDGKRLAMAHGAGKIGLWNVASAQLEHLLETHRIVSTPFFSPDGTRVVANYQDRAEIFDVATGKSLQRLPLTPAKDGVRIESVLAVRNDGKLLTSGRDSRRDTYSVILWDPAARKRWDLLKDLPGRPFALSPRRTMVLINQRHVTSPRDRGWSSIHLWSLPDRRRLAEYGVAEPFHGFSFSPDEKSIAFVCEDRSVRIWDLTDLLTAKD